MTNFIGVLNTGIQIFFHYRTGMSLYQFFLTVLLLVIDTQKNVVDYYLLNLDGNELVLFVNLNNMLIKSIVLVSP